MLMDEMKRKTDDIIDYIQDQESVANSYVMRCFFVTMIVYTSALVLNLLGIFIIDQRLMWQGYIPSFLTYLIMYLVCKKVSLSDPRMKYLILFSNMLVLTLMGVSITYHVVLGALLPILCAMLYSSKKMMRYVYILTIISTIVIVYGGYYNGLCDANMALLTTGRIGDYISEGKFILTEVNPNPEISLMLFFVVPRCLIYIAYVFVCSNIIKIVSGSLERVRLTAELEKAKEEAEKANRAKSQFLAGISHEIRTPINAVMGMNEMILRETQEEHIRKYAVDVKNSSVILLNLINEILDSSKIESGKMEIIESNYHMASLLNDLYNMTNIKAKEKGLQLVFDIDEKIPKEYFGDVKRIQQVLLNLLSNAVKYTEHGTVTMKLTCSVKEETATLHFAVRDTGIGIKPEDIGKIYDEFQRLDVNRNKNIEGTGLGMKLARQFLKLMGSDLKIESEYEKGSEFSFDLQQKVTDTGLLGDFKKRLEETEVENIGRMEYTAPEAKILIVDDSRINRKVFVGLTKGLMMQVEEAQSGQQCLDMVCQNKYDIVFLDHMMPGLDGIETLHIMKEKGFCENIPVIMLTANAIVGDKERYLDEGFDDFLSKPIVPEQLDQMIWKYLPKSKIIEKNQAPKKLSTDQLRDKFEGIDIDAGLANCMGDENLYADIFMDFVQLPIREELSEHYSNGDYKNYCIAIHGFKNNAYSVGAMELGNMAYEMEKATKTEFPDNLRDMEEALYCEYESICKKYADKC